MHYRNQEWNIFLLKQDKIEIKNKIKSLAFLASYLKKSICWLVEFQGRSLTLERVVWKESKPKVHLQEDFQSALLAFHPLHPMIKAVSWNLQKMSSEWTLCSEYFGKLFNRWMLEYMWFLSCTKSINNYTSSSKWILLAVKYLKQLENYPLLSPTVSKNHTVQN